MLFMLQSCHWPISLAMSLILEFICHLIPGVRLIGAGFFFLSCTQGPSNRGSVVQGDIFRCGYTDYVSGVPTMDGRFLSATVKHRSHFTPFYWVNLSPSFPRGHDNSEARLSFPAQQHACAKVTIATYAVYTALPGCLAALRHIRLRHGFLTCAVCAYRRRWFSRHPPRLELNGCDCKCYSTPNSLLLFA